MYLIEKKNLARTLKDWSADHEVYAPQYQGDYSQFLPVDEPSDLALNEPHNTRYPPKALFLPQTEPLLKFNPRLNQFEDARAPQQSRIIFGLRPCDATAIKLLDTVFDSEDISDPYWKARRDATVLIGIGCTNPPQTCFCTTVGYGPFNPDGLDALLTELGDSYLIETFTEKGKSLFVNLPKASDTDQSEVESIQTNAIESMTPAFETSALKPNLDALFENDYWAEISESCLGCGVCTFLCPTCFCFDILDEVQRNERVRNWDTCMFRIYSQEASGHNPRPTRKERTRQRLMHKFSYWVDQIGKIGCTGCGRCVRYCPVGLDIRAMLRTANTVESESINA